MISKAKLQEYLTGVCPLYEDLDILDREGKKEMLDMLAKEGCTPDTVFLRAEQRADGMHYFYQCPNCEMEEEKVLPIEKDFLYIGSGPADDERYSNYTSWLTCTALLIQLKNTFGSPPEGARVHLRQESGYMEVVCDYDTRFPLSMAYAFMLEGNLPAKWSPAAIRFLKEQTSK